MNAREIYLCKAALRILGSVGPQGLCREAWMEQLGIESSAPLTTAEEAALIERLERNTWVQSYRDPIRDQVRYVLSGTGTLALGTL